MENLKKYWWIWGFIYAVALFGAKLQAIAMAPEQLEKTSGQVSQLSESLEKYIAENEEFKLGQQKQIELLTKIALNGNE